MSGRSRTQIETLDAADKTPSPAGREESETSKEGRERTLTHRPEAPECGARSYSRTNWIGNYAWNELPQPQVDFTFGLSNLKPEPSSVSM